MKTKSLLAACAAALATAALVTLPASAAPSRPAADPARTVQYAKVQRSCATPRPGQKACFALKLVPVAKGTPGAKPMAVLPPSVDHGPTGRGYAPSAFATAYRYDPAATLATPQTVAIVDAHNNPNVLNDLNHFNAHYGLPAETADSFKIVNQAGHTAPLPSNDVGWGREIALDVEAVRGACNECKILLVEANTATAGNLATAVNTAARLGATEISNSYGGPENPNVSSSVKNAYNHPGIVITAATGDDGWFSWDLANGGGRSANRTNTPAAYPWVVAVTGTKLVLNSDGTRRAETVWNENGKDNAIGGFRTHRGMGASGGGCSNIYSAQSWQKAVPNYSAMGCRSGKRVAADVAAVADPQTGFDIYDTFGPQDNGWETIGGTSLSSPLVAAMWALAGGAADKYPAKTLYDRLKYTAGTSRYDVKVGGNSWCAGDAKSTCSTFLKRHVSGSNGNPNNLVIGGHPAGILDCGYKFSGAKGTIPNDRQCYAKIGYDGTSGVGAPKGLSLFQSLLTVQISGPDAVSAGGSNQWSATVVDHAGGTAASYRWTWGDGSGASSGASPSHIYADPGTFKVTVTVTDNLGLKGSATMTVTVS
jgi:hypothetical protein